MVIKVDEEAADLVKQMCDISLKAGGLNSLQGVLMVVNNLQILKPEKSGETKAE